MINQHLVQLQPHQKWQNSSDDIPNSATNCTTYTSPHSKVNGWSGIRLHPGVVSMVEGGEHQLVAVVGHGLLRKASTVAWAEWKSSDRIMRRDMRLELLQRPLYNFWTWSIIASRNKGIADQLRGLNLSFEHMVWRLVDSAGHCGTMNRVQHTDTHGSNGLIASKVTNYDLHLYFWVESKL